MMVKDDGGLLPRHISPSREFALKLTITLAGPVANFLLAVIIYTIIFFVGSEELSPVSEGAKQGSACSKVRNRRFVGRS